MNDARQRICETEIIIRRVKAQWRLIALRRLGVFGQLGVLGHSFGLAVFPPESELED